MKVLIVVTCAAAFQLSYRVSEYRRNEAHTVTMMAARRNLSTVLELVKNERNFGPLGMYSSSGHGGSLTVEGTLESEEQLQTLKNMVSLSNLRVPVYYEVSIVSAERKAQREQLEREKASRMEDPG